jgi:hypothetical protein
MSKCLNCGKQTELKQQTGKPRKYCSKVCNRKYLTEQERKKHPRYNDPTWKNKAKQIQERRQKKKEKYEWYKANWYSVERIAQEFGISKHAIHPRAKTAGIESTIVGYSAPTAFWSPEDAKKIATINEQVTPIPEGYLTKPEAAQYLGTTKSTFGQYCANYGHPRSIEWQQTHGHKSTIKLYTKKDLDEWKVKLEKFRQEKAAETKKRQAERRLQKEQENLQKQREFEEATKNLLTSKQAAEIMGYKTITPNVKSKLTPIVLEGHKPRIWYNKEEVCKIAKELHIEREKENERKKEKKRLYGNSSRAAPLKSSFVNVTDDEWYELKLKSRIENIGPSKSVKKNKRLMQSWQANIETMKLYEEKGIVTELFCYDCKKELPYWKFYVEFKAGKERRGRRNQCKICCKSRRKSHKKTAKQQSKKVQFPTYLATSIKEILNRKNQTFSSYSNTIIWSKLPYTKQEFIEHIEKHFEPWMNWDNHGRSPTLNNPKWQLDHVIAKSSFNYTSMDDEEFKKCWSLENLKPIGAFMNVIKSDKDLRKNLNASYRRAFKTNSPTGIWTYLPYSIQEAKEHFESQFSNGMSWDNYGKLWDVEHIIPQAALPYTSITDGNFKICWGLDNLKPLIKALNCAKGSKYNGKIHVYNDVQDTVN